MPLPRRLLPALFAPLLLPARPAEAWSLFAGGDLPDARLVDQDGRPRRFQSQVLGARRAVAIELIFGGCQSVCPISTRIMVDARAELGARADDLLSVSLTLDPERDTPAVLASYADKAEIRDSVRAGHWTLLTGSPAEMHALLRGLRLRFGTVDDHPTVFFVGDGRARRLARLVALPPVCELAGAMRAALDTPRGADTATAVQAATATACSG